MAESASGQKMALHYIFDAKGDLHGIFYIRRHYDLFARKTKFTIWFEMTLGIPTEKTGAYFSCVSEAVKSARDYFVRKSYITRTGFSSDFERRYALWQFFKRTYLSEDEKAQIDKMLTDMGIKITGILLTNFQIGCTYLMLNKMADWKKIASWEKLLTDWSDPTENYKD